MNEINAQGWEKRLGLVELGFRIPIVSGIPDSFSCIPDSKVQDSTFRKQFNWTSKNFLDSGNRISLHEAKNRKKKNNLSGAIYTVFQEDLYLLKRGYFQV